MRKTLFLTFIFSILFFNSVSASDVPGDLKEKLEEIGLEDHLIQNLSEEQIIQIEQANLDELRVADVELKKAGKTRVTEDGEIIEEEYDANTYELMQNDVFSARSNGNIENLDLTLSALQLSNSEFIVFANYEWDPAPFFQHRDLLVVNWPSTSYLRTPEDGNGGVRDFTAHDFSWSGTSSTGSCTNTGYELYNETFRPFDVEPGSGIAHRIDLPGVLGFPGNNCRFMGSMSFPVVQDPVTSSTIQMKLEYGHATAQINPSISYGGGGGSFSVNSTWSTDIDWVLYDIHR
ncbi:hypothetical protein RYX56_08775 [Alkalihalophilus lindianensis]|uniref:Uncharacterized protein n=1 Tax=Alkalihalophilus lindianensis TaxID=1630542 RepID=A0ABU3X9A7_9BACI|nr:hypothetical protein [Alkalihalophilus lindianensis]MDV2684462.1 hypothetical protein [Alkalihalophilus lindianensis]